MLLLKQRRLNGPNSSAVTTCWAPRAGWLVGHLVFDAPLAAVVAHGLREAMHRDGLGALRDLAWVSAPEPSTYR
ncbi:hypothetical protein [Streptomyces pseudovenezuelae]|uniref:hypothetical protein n=1 Tax=Streptomyces pseudovenezuelae TaxID=67350 RepID=UPI0037195E69